MEFYTKPAEKVLEHFHSSPSTGLSDDQVEKNREAYGKNAFTKADPVSLYKRIIDALTEPMILMLLFAGVITLLVNVIRLFTGGEADFWEAGGVFAAIFLSTLISVIIEGRSEKAFEELSKVNQDILVKILRGGQVQLVNQENLVCGDIVLIAPGDKITADMRILDADHLHANESALTGESQEVEKQANPIAEEKTPLAERNNMLYSGSFVTSGNAKGIVVAVGDQTEFGKIAESIQDTEAKSTPLQEKMLRLGKTITKFGCTAAAIVFIIEIILLLMRGQFNLDTVSDAFVTSVVLIVAAVPEGLPTIVAVSLSLNIIKMSKQNALVKKMIACETIGCINVLCSDKTGTLTENKMTLRELYEGNKQIAPKDVSKLLKLNMILNGTASLDSKNENVIGNPTEGALLLGLEHPEEYLEIREYYPSLHVFPFSSENKNMTTIVEIDGKPVALTKGSPEKILSLSKLTPREQKAIEQEIALLQNEARRVIAFAHKDLESFKDEDQKGIETDMVFDGFAAINDPLRADVKEAVERSQRAGIDLKILTGDNLLTAQAIAKELDLLGEGSLCKQAGELEEMTDEELLKILPDIKIIARSTPHMKMRIVKLLKGKGDIVALTGDGINDAPAIKAADVGISMGINGTEITKEASDIVLLDDSFSTIEKAIQWGRGIYENFQRFLQFQLTVNVSSVMTVLASILTGFAAPFTALQLLWINLVMDGPPALTLGLEPIRNDLMNRPPTKRDAEIVTKPMMTRIMLNALYVSVLFMLQHWFNFLGGTEEELPTILFTFFVIIHLFNAYNCRELSDTSLFANIKNNTIMLWVFAGTFLLQYIITQYGGLFFNTVPLSTGMWLKILLLGFTIIIVNEFAKWISRSRKKAH